MERRGSLCGPQATARRKPVGGFCFISGTALISAWWAYRRGFVTRLDLRVWLACFEAVARRCGVPRGRQPRYTLTEVRALVGSSSNDELQRSLARLSARGLVLWSESAVRVGSPVCTASEQEECDLRTFLAQVPNHARPVPVPRRVMRLLARSGTRLGLATVFGHLLRCSYYRAGQCRPTGTCKASWIAGVFGVDVRNVKAARKAFVELGVLRFERVGQRFLNRHGPLMSLNLDWAPPAAAQDRLPPPPRSLCDELPPLIGDLKLLRNSRNQNPAPAGRVGVCGDAGCPRKPRLGHVEPADLTDAARLGRLFEQACARGLVQATESERLNFFAMAEHARAVARRNVAGLFAANVRQRRWQVLTLADEDRARRRLCAYGVERQPGASETRSHGTGAACPISIGAVVDRVMGDLAKRKKRAG